MFVHQCNEEQFLLVEEFTSIWNPVCHVVIKICRKWEKNLWSSCLWHLMPCVIYVPIHVHGYCGSTCNKAESFLDVSGRGIAGSNTSPARPLYTWVEWGKNIWNIYCGYDFLQLHYWILKQVFCIHIFLRHYLDSPWLVMGMCMYFPVPMHIFHRRWLYTCKSLMNTVDVVQVSLFIKKTTQNLVI